MRKELAMPLILVGSLLAGLLVSSVDLNGMTSDDVSPLVDLLLMLFVFVVSVDVGGSMDK